jgi:hypothetical protein
MSVIPWLEGGLGDESGQRVSEPPRSPSDYNGTALTCLLENLAIHLQSADQSTIDSL